MSNPSPAGDQHGDTTDESIDEESGERTLETVAPGIAAPIRKLGFWGAIVFPILYVPMLATGLSTSLEIGFFLALIAVNIAALYVGHAYADRRDGRRSHRGA